MFPYFGWTATTNHVDSEGGGGLLKNLSVHKGGGGVRHKIALKFAKNRKKCFYRSGGGVFQNSTWFSRGVGQKTMSVHKGGEGGVKSGL